MRNANEIEVKELSESCIKALEKNIESLDTVENFIMFARGYLETDDTCRGIRGLNFLPFEVLDYCFNHGKRACEIR